MPSRARLLCVGKDPSLLETRRSVLAVNGYDAVAAGLIDSESMLRQGRFDLIIVCSSLDEWEYGHLVPLSGAVPLLKLEAVTMAQELLNKVDDKLLDISPDVTVFTM